MAAPEEWIVLFSTPIYVALILIEFVFSKIQDKKYYSFRDSVTNLIFMILNALFDLTFRLIYLIPLYFFYQYRIIEFNFNAPLYWVLLFICEDFVFYWLHYVGHHVRLFWTIHVTHHNSNYFNLTTGFRSAIFEPLYRFIYFIPLVLIGFQPLHLLIMYSITQIYGILVHTEYNIRLGWLENIFVTPSHHRVHHASNVIYLDKNMGMCLIIWDKIFGTYQEELESEPPVFGLTHDLEDKSIFGEIFGEFLAGYEMFRRHILWKDKLKIIFKPPGWSVEGKTKTSKE